MITEEATHRLRRRFEQFAELRARYGTSKALDLMMSGQAEHQKKLMGPFISKVSLSEGFRKSIPIFEEFGMKMEVVDISNNNKDAVLEIQWICPYMSLAREFGLQTPCQITCDMEVTAVEEAFPDIKARILSKQACGDCVCVFKYERDSIRG
jgi:predicted ArsR family transcriptional regulator